MQTVVAPTGVALEAIDRKQRAAWLDEGIDVFEREMSSLLGRVVVVKPEVAAIWTHKCHLRLTQPESGDASAADDTPWHEARNCPTGSRVGGIFGYGVYADSSRYAIFLEIVGLRKSTVGQGGPWTRLPLDHGKFYENVCLALFEKHTGKVVMPFDFFKFDPVPGGEPDYFVCAYSPDGITTDGELVEAKAPYSLFTGSRDFEHGFIPFHYDLGQTSYGLWLLQRGLLPSLDNCYYMEYRPPASHTLMENEQLSITKTSRDPEWATRHVWFLREFAREVADYRRTGVLPPQYASSPAACKVYYDNLRRNANERGPSGEPWPRSLDTLERFRKLRIELPPPRAAGGGGGGRKRKECSDECDQLEGMTLQLARATVSKPNNERPRQPQPPSPPPRARYYNAHMNPATALDGMKW